MEAQQTGTPPNASKLGIFRDSIRKFVIIFMILFFVIAGTIGVIGIINGWDIVFNAIFMVLAVVAAILAILTFWDSTKSKEVPAQVSSATSTSPSVQVIINNNPEEKQVSSQGTSESTMNNANNNQATDQNTVINTGAANPQQVPNNIPNTIPPEQPVKDKISQISRDDLLDKLSQCIPATFNKVVFCSGMRESDLPDGDRTTKAIRLIQWAESSGSGLKKIYECYESEVYGKKNPPNLQ